MLRECIHCNSEFNDRDPKHRKGKINECGDCAVEIVKPKKAIINTEGGDFAGITVVSSDQFEKYKRSLDDNANLVKEK